MGIYNSIPTNFHSDPIAYRFQLLNKLSVTSFGIVACALLGT